MASNNPRLKTPESVSKLTDVSVYSYSCAQGLCKGKHLRSDVVVQGTTIFLCNMLANAGESTKKDLESLSGRYGG